MSRAYALYSLIKDIFFLLDDGDRHLLGEYDLTVSRFYILYHLGEQPGLSVSELSDAMFCDKSNITRLIRSMEEEGLVNRLPHPTDGRALSLQLTPAGAAKRAEVWEAHIRHNRQRFDAYLEDLEQQDLFAHLHRLKSNLQTDLATRP
jgi:DNA-binding MarR family transcriptional regulator